MATERNEPRRRWRDGDDDRAMRLARGLLLGVALLVIATIAMIVWANVSFGAVWIALAAILLLLVVGAIETLTVRRRRAH